MAAMPRQRYTTEASDGVPVRQLCLMGTFQLRMNGEPVPLPSRAERLVAFLALRGRMGRASLAGRLWPDVVARHAQAALRTAMWRANRASPGLVVALSGTVGLAEDVDLDVTRQATAARVLLGGGPPPTGEEIRWALDSTDLLVDWDDEWLIGDRERLRQLRMHMCEAMSERLLEDGLPGLAMDAALVVLRMDPLRESGYRAVIRVHLAEGNVAAARRSYAECLAVFRRDLGLRPTFRLDDLSPDRHHDGALALPRRSRQSQS